MSRGVAVSVEPALPPPPPHLHHQGSPPSLPDQSERGEERHGQHLNGQNDALTQSTM